MTNDSVAAVYVGLMALAEALGEADPALAKRLENALRDSIDGCFAKKASVTTLNLLKGLLESVETGREVSPLA